MWLHHRCELFKLQQEFQLFILSVRYKIPHKIRKVSLFCHKKCVPFLLMPDDDRAVMKVIFAVPSCFSDNNWQRWSIWMDSPCKTALFCLPALTLKERRDLDNIRGRYFLFIDKSGKKLCLLDKVVTIWKGEIAEIIKPFLKHL